MFKGNVMEIKLEITRENEDGSADAMVHFDKEGLAFLVQEGIIAILWQYIKQQETHGKKTVKSKTDKKPTKPVSSRGVRARAKKLQL
jgi:phosphomannomutase